MAQNRTRGKVMLQTDRFHGTPALWKQGTSENRCGNDMPHFGKVILKVTFYCDFKQKSCRLVRICFMRIPFMQLVLVALGEVDFGGLVYNHFNCHGVETET